MQIYGKSEGFHFSGALFGSVSYNDPWLIFRCIVDLQTHQSICCQGIPWSIVFTCISLNRCWTCWSSWEGEGNIWLVVFKDFGLFSPRNLGKISKMTKIFQMGWNHQPLLLLLPERLFGFIIPETTKSLPPVWFSIAKFFMCACYWRHDTSERRMIERLKELLGIKRCAKNQCCTKD